MTSQQHLKPLHSKILEVFRLKSAKKNSKDPRQQLFFKIRPEKSVSELIIPYKDLKDNFPYALIEYYEAKTKIKNESSSTFQHLLAQSEKNAEKLKAITEGQKRQTRKIIRVQKEDKIQLQEHKDQSQGENVALILDYDKYLQNIERPIMKSFHVLFSESQPNQNRYLKDLNNDQNNMYARRANSTTSSYESRRKKLRIDYAQ